MAKYGIYTPGSLPDVVRDIGKRPAVVSIYRKFGDPFPMDECRQIRSLGATPMITWEPWSGFGQIFSGAAEDYVRTFARASGQFGQPVLLRFAHEMNGDWYPNWSGPRHVAAWNRLHQMVSEVTENTFRWVWCPNVAYPGSIPFEDLYPGDAVVDIVGLDGYNMHEDWRDFRYIFAPSIMMLRQITKKPMMICEMASREGKNPRDKARWINDAFAILQREFPFISVAVWFNQNKEHDWRYNSSKASRKAFLKAVR